MTKEMDMALEQDGEKLRALTGENHGPFLLRVPEDETAFENWWDEQCRLGDPVRRTHLAHDAFLAGFKPEAY